VEEVLVKASFRNAMRWRRCLVPADGFYEWAGEKGKIRPFLLRPRLDVKGTSPEEAAALLQPVSDDLFEAIQMHPKINDSKPEEPGILEPLQS